MRNGVLSALLALAATHGSALAQRQGTAAGQPVGLPDATYRSIAVDAQAEPPDLHASGEYLIWWIKGGGVPPLATAGGDGKLGSLGTRVLLDDLDFADDARHGGRFSLGYCFASAPLHAAEASFLFLPGGRPRSVFSSRGDPVLAQPFTDADTGRPDANLVAFPATAAGAVTVGARTELWGAEANLAGDLTRAEECHLTALGGFRFLSLLDEVVSGEQFQVAPGVPGFGGSRVTLRDEFRTTNRFYGGQVGLRAGARFGLFSIDLQGKVGLGQMQQVGHVSGATRSVAPNGTTTTFQGGLYALRSNAGRHERDELAVLPEVGLNVGARLTPRLNLFAGYTLLWVSTVARAGEQIDPVVNVSQFPIRSGNGPLVGTPRPAFAFNGADFWAQGLNLGLELRY
jgi:hypothetical protein